MAYNIDDYENVETRIKRFYTDFPDARIITVDYTSAEDRKAGMWRVQALVFLDKEDQAADLPKASGLAFEVDGTPGANKTSALENAETSAIGRALANANYSGNRRASREEMEKVSRGITPQPNVSAPEGWESILFDIGDMEQLRAFYTEAADAGWLTEDIKKKFTERKQSLG
jgi:hypothetical protein